MTPRAQISPAEITNKVWALSHVLRDDGIVFHKYISELTYLLFLKIAEERGTDSNLPDGCNWSDLTNYTGRSLVGHYRKMLTRLGEDSKSATVRAIFGFPTTVFSHDENLRKVIKAIDAISWADAKSDAFGTIYESLLERNATESRSGAGQYFTPRPLVDCMVGLLKLRPGLVIQDPAVGTGGFLISAWEHMRSKYSAAALKAKQTHFEGLEIERDTYRLCLMNLFLHGIKGKVVHGDALTNDASELAKADIIFANPPFGSGAGSARPRRTDLLHSTSNKQLMFLQHIYHTLKPGGQAAVIVPDNVLFEPGIGRKVRTDLMKGCNLHMILRLPQGIFYAQGVNTNVLFFEKGAPTKEVWFYDLRTNQRRFNKSNPLSDKTFEPFATAFEARTRFAKSKKIKIDDERLKRYSRRDIADRDDNLDLTWLPDARSLPHEIDDLQAAIDQIIGSVQSALDEISEVEKEIVGR